MIGVLALDIAAIASAPLLDRTAGRWPGAYGLLRDSARLAVAAIVALEILPEGWAAVGFPALLAVALGLVLPFALERHTHETTASSLAATAAALAFHHLLDGLALGQPGGHLGIAVVLHTIPVALLGWRLAARERGPAAGAVLLAFIACFTVAGFVLARAGTGQPGPATALLSCFLGGWLVHALGHREHEHAPHAHSS